MHTVRLKDGLSGYINMSESEYDSFGTGHSSTTISAGLGISFFSYLYMFLCRIGFVIWLIKF